MSRVCLGGMVAEQFDLRITSCISTRLNVPISVIGPTAVVPNPTVVTLANSLSILRISLGNIEEIQDKETNVSVALIEPKLLVKV